MARMMFSDGTETRDYPAMQARLAALGITLRHWPAPEDPQAQALLERAALNDEEKEQLLRAVDDRFEALKREAGYITRDLIVIHEGIPDLAALLAKFEKIHYHTDDEVRYVLAGRGCFGFVEPDGGQFLLEVHAGDYINVPARAEHWFTMGDAGRIKAVRYFMDSSGWAPVYTDRPMQFG